MNRAKTIIFMTLAVSIGAALIDLLLYQFNQVIGLQFILSLSSLFWNSYFLWQPVSYLFVIQPNGGLDLPFFLPLIFQMFMVWIFGSPIAERYGNRSFLKLYLFSGILSGLFALAFKGISPFHSPISGPEASLFALFTVWTMMHPEGEVLLYFLFPVKAKWLLVAGLGIFAFIGGPLPLLIGGTLCGYFYGAFFKELSFPFEFIHPVDRWLRIKKRGKAEIIPFKKEIESDEDFLDRMLEKISKKGKDSLTKKEQRRLDEISKKKSE